MPMVVMLMVLRSVPMDITDILRTPVLLTDTMARRGLAADSLLVPVPGIAVITDVATMDTADTVESMAIAAAMDMAAVMRMVVAAMAEDTAVAMLADVPATAAVFTAAVAASTVAAVMAADDGNRQIICNKNAHLSAEVGVLLFRSSVKITSPEESDDGTATYGYGKRVWVRGMDDGCPTSRF